MIFLRHVLKICTAAFLLVCMDSCSSRPQYLPEDALKRYVSDEKSGLTKTASADPFVMQTTYRPTDLMVAQQLRSIKTPTTEDIRRARGKFSSYYYFVVRFSKSGRDILDPGISGLGVFSDLMQTVSFRMAEHVNMTTPQRDTIPVADYVYDRTFGMGQGTEVLFVFDKSKAIGQEWVDLNVSEFGLGMGNQSVRFSVRDLEEAPKIFK